MPGRQEGDEVQLDHALRDVLRNIVCTRMLHKERGSSVESQSQPYSPCGASNRATFHFLPQQDEPNIM